MSLANREDIAKKKEFWLRRYDSVQEEVGAFNRYQITLLLVTQLANAAVTGSMLCTIYDMAPPTSFTCYDDDVGSENITSLCVCKNASLDVEFHSLWNDLFLFCSNDYIPTLMTSSIMAGGVVGAAIFGYFADRHGRKLLCIVALIGCGSANLSLYLASYHWATVIVAFLMLGLFGGGYMVVNSVLLMECVGGSRWRLLCACLNGWPFGIMFMALVGVLTKHWLWYHLSLAGLAFIFALIFCLFVHESPRWLVAREKFSEAENILSKIAQTNGRTLMTLKSREEAIQLTKKQANGETFDNKKQANGEHLETYQLKTYSYLDLVRHSFIAKRLAALTYCWLAASVVSFGLYFNLGSLAGDRYLNTFLTGLFKGTTGCLPYLLDRCGVGRKPVLVTSVVVTCFSCWAAVLFHFIHSSSAKSSWFTTVFAIVGSSAIDPMWKINHLYSTELFPTVIRNMARAVCNVGSRFGSLIGPQVAYLNQIYFPLSFVVYGVVGLFHITVAFFCLPETKGRPLVDRIPSKEEDASYQLSILRVES